MKEKVIEIPIDDIVVDPEFKRENLDETTLEELAKSIEQHGLLQPILVRKVKDKYHLIYGYRRLNAAKKLGRRRIPAKVVDVDDKKAYLLHLTENIQRQDLSDYDFMIKVARAIEKYGYTQQELADKLGVSRYKISIAYRVYKHGKEYHHRIKLGEMSIREVYDKLPRVKQKCTSITPSDVSLIHHSQSLEEQVPITSSNVPAEHRATDVVEIMDKREETSVGKPLERGDVTDRKEDDVWWWIWKGDYWVCPVCGKKFKLVHVEPSKRHRLIQFEGWEEWLPDVEEEE